MRVERSGTAFGVALMFHVHVVDGFRNSARLLSSFCEASQYDIQPSLHGLLRHLLQLFNDESTDVCSAAWQALGTVTKVASATESRYRAAYG